MTADIANVKSKTPFLKNSSDQTRLNLRNAFGSFLTGVTVITTLDNNGSSRGLMLIDLLPFRLIHPCFLFVLLSLRLVLRRLKNVIIFQLMYWDKVCGKFPDCFYPNLKTNSRLLNGIRALPISH